MVVGRCSPLGIDPSCLWGIEIIRPVNLNKGGFERMLPSPVTISRLFMPANAPLSPVTISFSHESVFSDSSNGYYNFFQFPKYTHLTLKSHFYPRYQHYLLLCFRFSLFSQIKPSTFSKKIQRRSWTMNVNVKSLTHLL